MRVRRNERMAFLETNGNSSRFPYSWTCSLKQIVSKKMFRGRIGGREDCFALETFHPLKALLSWGL